MYFFIVANWVREGEIVSLLVVRIITVNSRPSNEIFYLNPGNLAAREPRVIPISC